MYIQNTTTKRAHTTARNIQSNQNKYSSIKKGLENFFTGGAADAARFGAIASHLTGLAEGPGDSFRHLLVAAELYRKFPNLVAQSILWGHEDFNFRGRLGSQDNYMNEVGRLIGLHIRKKGGTFEEVAILAQKYIQENLSDITPENIKEKWIVGGGKKVTIPSF